MPIALEVSVKELNMLHGWARVVVSEQDCVVHPGDVVRAAVTGTGGVLCGTVARTAAGPEATSIWIDLDPEWPPRRVPPARPPIGPGIG